MALLESTRYPQAPKICNFSEIIWHSRTPNPSEIQISRKLCVGEHINFPILVNFRQMFIKIG